MHDIYERIATFKKQGIDMVVVTAVEKKGEGPVDVGKKMIVTEDGTSYGTVGGGMLEYQAIQKAEKLFETRSHLHERYVLSDGKVVKDAKTLPMICGGVVTFFYEFIGVKNYVTLFGAGHVGQALAHVLKPLNFHITVVDDREAVLNKFTDANQKILQNFADYIDDKGLKPNSYVIVCTPSHKYDYHVINKILEHDLKPKYMGMLCSLEKLKDYLKKTYDHFGETIDLSHFYSPIGLDLGGGSPEEIAISIAAEMLAVHHDKPKLQHMREMTNDNHRYWQD